MKQSRSLCLIAQHILVLTIPIWCSYSVAAYPKNKTPKQQRVSAKSMEHLLTTYEDCNIYLLREATPEYWLPVKSNRNKRNPWEIIALDKNGSRVIELGSMTSILDWRRDGDTARIIGTFNYVPADTAKDSVRLVYRRFRLVADAWMPYDSLTPYKIFNNRFDAIGCLFFVGKDSVSLFFEEPKGKIKNAPPGVERIFTTRADSTGIFLMADGRYSIYGFEAQPVITASKIAEPDAYHYICYDPGTRSRVISIKSGTAVAGEEYDTIYYTANSPYMIGKKDGDLFAWKTGRKQWQTVKLPQNDLHNNAKWGYDNILEPSGDTFKLLTVTGINYFVEKPLDASYTVFPVSTSFVVFQKDTRTFLMNLINKRINPIPVPSDFKIERVVFIPDSVILIETKSGAGYKLIAGEKNGSVWNKWYAMDTTYLQPFTINNTWKPDGSVGNSYLWFKTGKDEWLTRSLWQILNKIEGQKRFRTIMGWKYLSPELDMVKSDAFDAASRPEVLFYDKTNNSMNLVKSTDR